MNGGLFCFSEVIYSLQSRREEPRQLMIISYLSAIDGADWLVQRLWIHSRLIQMLRFLNRN
jgi:hypothetical protein